MAPPLHGGLTRDEVVAMFKRRERALNTHDATTLADDYTEEVVVISPTAGTHVGRKAAREVLERVFEALDTGIDTQALLIDGDQVAHVMRVEGANLGSLLGLPPTGKTFELTAVFLHELRDRKIVREVRVFDFTGMLLKIGLLKVKPV